MHELAFLLFLFQFHDSVSQVVVVSQNKHCQEPKFHSFCNCGTDELENAHMQDSWISCPWTSAECASLWVFSYIFVANIDNSLSSLLLNRTTLPPETLTWDPLEIHSTFFLILHILAQSRSWSVFRDHFKLCSLCNHMNYVWQKWN